MNIDIKALETNVNLQALQPQFLDLELHYVIAGSANNFRFADWNEQPKQIEQKFYCFLQEQELYIPEGDILLQESYQVTDKPIYPVISDCKDFLSFIKDVKQRGVAKGIRQFTTDDLTKIKQDLQKEFETVETHVVTSPELQHHIFVVNDVEVSVAPTMVYFRIKALFSESHYQSAKEES